MPVLFTFYIQCVLKLKKIIPAPKRLTVHVAIWHIFWRHRCVQTGYSYQNKTGCNVLYVHRAIEARSCNRCCGGKAMSIIQPVCVCMCVCVCVCSLRYPACNAYAPYCHLWPVLLYNTFSTFSHKRHDFRKKKVTAHKMWVLSSSTTFAWNIFHSEENWAIYEQGCTLVCM